MDNNKNHDFLAGFCDYTGLLRDKEISAAIDRNLLVTRDTADKNRIRQASYELRLSDDVQFLVLKDSTSGEAQAQYESPANGIGTKLTIEPGHTVKVKTIEVINLPDNVAAHIISVGNIYKLGLSPETTYADPGFIDSLYIIISNYSSRVVELEVGQPIARAEFVKLSGNVDNPLSKGRAKSEPKFWPRRVRRRDEEQLKETGVDRLLNELFENDPPSFEHAFITKFIRQQVNEQLSDLSERLGKLERRWDRLSACFHVACYLLGILIAIVVIGKLWPYLSANLHDKVEEEAVHHFFDVAIFLIPLFSKRLRSRILFAFRGFH